MSLTPNEDNNVTATSAATEPTPEPAVQTQATAQPAKATEGKVFSEEYVKALRSESAGYRTTAKSYDAALRKLLGVDETEKLGNLDERINAVQAAHAKEISDALNKANARLISAELKNLDGYDTKLLTKVMDFSGVKIDDNGDVTGLKEAAEAAAKEYPAVLVNKTPAYASGTGTAPVGNGKYTADEIVFRKAAGLPID